MASASSFAKLKPAEADVQTSSPSSSSSSSSLNVLDFSSRKERVHQWYIDSSTQWSVWARKCKMISRALCSQDRFLTIATTVGIVYSIGFFEAMLLSKRPYYYSFLFHYAKEQVIPSVIWSTKPASDILIAMGKMPEKYLLDSNNNILNNMANAKRRLRIQWLQTMRSIIFGFVGISQLISLSVVISDTNEEYYNNVMNGKECFLKNNNNSNEQENNNSKSIRFIGSYADSAVYNMINNEHNYENIIPILEILENDKIQKKFRLKMTQNGIIPSFWGIMNENYSDENEWKNFDQCITNDILYNCKERNCNDTKYLIIEGDCSVSEESSIMIENNNNVDLALSEFVQGLSSIENIVRNKKSLNKNVKIVKILLCNENYLFESGGLFKYSIKDRIKKFNDVDLLIDTKKPLIKEILKWLNTCNDNNNDSNKNSKNDNILLFDTCNHEYYVQISQTLEKHGWIVKDFMHYCETNNGNIEGMPLLIYENDSYKTVNTLQSHLRTFSINSYLNNCCVLIDDYEAINNLKQLENKYDCHDKINYVCSGIVYDKIFNQIKDQIVNTHPDNIANLQNWIDAYITV